MALKGLSKTDDIPRLFEYIIKYVNDIESNKGLFNFGDKSVDRKSVV